MTTPAVNETSTGAAQYVAHALRKTMRNNRARGLPRRDIVTAYDLPQNDTHQLRAYTHVRLGSTTRTFRDSTARRARVTTEGTNMFNYATPEACFGTFLAEQIL